MLKIVLPYKVGTKGQIPFKKIEKLDIFIEANIFDSTYLTKKTLFKNVEMELCVVQQKTSYRIRALHFPTENADFIKKQDIRKSVYRAIDLCSKNKIPILVLHSNNIIREKQWNSNNISNTRKIYLDFFKQLDNYITDKKISLEVCIENMPIIGNKGLDFDSIFVFPEDFRQFKYKNIKITWDFCHWLFTFKMTETIGKLHPKLKTKDNTSIMDYLKIYNKISHFHFGSFKKLTFPGCNIDCEEGVMPNDGIIEETKLLKILKPLNTDKKVKFLTLEIKESDYSQRKNFFKTYKWINEHFPQEGKKS